LSDKVSAKGDAPTYSEAFEQQSETVEPPGIYGKASGFLMLAPTAPRMVFAFDVFLETGPPVDVGAVPGGFRRIIPITGGSFEGPEIRGKVLSGGGDWQTVRPDGFAEIDARWTLRTDSGVLVYLQNTGMRHGPPDVLARLRAGEPVDPAEYYFRTVPRFETSAQELRWLSHSIRLYGRSARRAGCHSVLAALIVAGGRRPHLLGWRPARKRDGSGKET
jgi:hypothetical protein